ncbi:hypothetical protein EC957_010194 [Mortierella hygrophila]|uniref:Uncharacterized protein n=1 Tax=Mortierella hygrophila TaxID=979708 RepID=A0A9P6K4K5_9FUNG|nr:hypothetical protein EC957_010194 [Mortierella hygrophila]
MQPTVKRRFRLFEREQLLPAPTHVDSTRIKDSNQGRNKVPALEHGSYAKDSNIIMELDCRITDNPKGRHPRHFYQSFLYFKLTQFKP